MAADLWFHGRRFVCSMCLASGCACMERSCCAKVKVVPFTVSFDEQFDPCAGLMKKTEMQVRFVLGSRIVPLTVNTVKMLGGLAYAEDYAASLVNHSIMLESDNGAFLPYGLGFSGARRSDTKLRRVR